MLSHRHAALTPISSASFSTSALYSSVYFCPIYNTLSLLYYITLGVRFYCITPGSLTSHITGTLFCELHLTRAILRLASCAYLYAGHNVIILDPIGTGELCLAYALGMVASCSFCSVRYIRLPDLMVEISVACANGAYRDYMKNPRKEKLLILDEWLLYLLKEAEDRDALELIEAGNKVVSTQIEGESMHKRKVHPRVIPFMMTQCTMLMVAMHHHLRSSRTF